jgi:hypothetical protein
MANDAEVQILATSASNYATNAIAVRIDSHIKSMKAEGLYVVRVHANASEGDIACQKARLKRKIPDDAKPQLIRDLEPEEYPNVDDRFHVFCIKSLAQPPGCLNMARARILSVARPSTDEQDTNKHQPRARPRQKRNEENMNRRAKQANSTKYLDKSATTYEEVHTKEETKGVLTSELRPDEHPCVTRRDVDALLSSTSPVKVCLRTTPGTIRIRKATVKTWFQPSSIVQDSRCRARDVH